MPDYPSFPFSDSTAIVIADSLDDVPATIRHYVLLLAKDEPQAKPLSVRFNLSGKLPFDGPVELEILIREPDL
jgi:hypothetical protein